LVTFFKSDERSRVISEVFPKKKINMDFLIFGNSESG
jgi:hypothetical protein